MGERRRVIAVGPSVRLVLSCFDCQHCKSESYTCQGDSGSELYCLAANGRHIGNSNWSTPNWCPFRSEAIRAAIGTFEQAAKGGG